MATTRIKDLSKTATTVASDANIVIDGSSNGTQKIARDNFRQDTADAYVAAPSTYKLTPLNGVNKIDAAYLPTSGDTPKGEWNASTNSPTLADGTGTAGDYYDVTTAGTANLGSGAITYTVGDVVKYNGATWFKIDSVANILDGISTVDPAKTTLQIIDVGTAANEVSVNGMLNSGAWLDFDAFYETGNWVPTVSFGGGSTGILYSSQEGLYIKTGKQVTVHGSITLSNKGSSLGSMRIAGLPYTSLTTTGSYQSVVIGLSANWDASVTETPALVVQSDSTQLLGTVALSGSEIQDTHFSNTTTLRFSVTYQIA